MQAPSTPIGLPEQITSIAAHVHRLAHEDALMFKAAVMLSGAVAVVTIAGLCLGSFVNYYNRRRDIRRKGIDFWGIILALLLFPGVARAQSDQIGPLEKGFATVLGADVGLSIYDGVRTVQLVESGRWREANPLYRRAVERHGIRYAMAWKVAGTVAMDGGLWWLWRTYPSERRWIFAALVTKTVLQGVVVGVNERRVAQARTQVQF